MMRRLGNSKGFTLLEVLVTIIVSAILAVLLMQFMSGHAWRSYWPLVKLNQGFELQGAMEKISADYRSLLINDLQPLVTLQGNIGRGDYFSGLPINVEESYCFDDLNSDDAASPGEQDASVTGICRHVPNEDLILKVTISYDGQSITALFTR